MHMQCGNEIEYYSLNERKFPLISAYCLCHMGPGQVGHSQIVLTELFSLVTVPFRNSYHSHVISSTSPPPNTVSHPNHVTPSQAQVKSPKFLCCRKDVEIWPNMIYSSSCICHHIQPVFSLSTLRGIYVNFQPALPG